MYIWSNARRAGPVQLSRGGNRQPARGLAVRPTSGHVPASGGIVLPTRASTAAASAAARRSWTATCWRSGTTVKTAGSSARRWRGNDAATSSPCSVPAPRLLQHKQHNFILRQQHRILLYSGLTVSALYKPVWRSLALLNSFLCRLSHRSQASRSHWQGLRCDTLVRTPTTTTTKLERKNA